MSTASGQKLKDYWQSLVDGELPPHRTDMQPAEMKSYLPDLMIAELHVDGTFLIRLAGTQVARRFGIDLTSKRISGNCSGVIGGIANLIETCSVGGEPVAGCIPYLDGVETFDAVNCVVLPLRDASGEIICKGYSSNGGFFGYPECGPIDEFVIHVFISFNLIYIGTYWMIISDQKLNKL